jgi:hypothetical protein
MMAASLLAATASADDTMTKSTVVPQGRAERFGHAEMVVAAPVAFVRDQATDFAHYKDFSNGRIRQSRLVDKRAGSTDVYLQVPVLHGMVTLWQVLRFSDVKRSADGTETFTGKLVSGNVRAAEMTVARARRAIFFSCRSSPRRNRRSTRSFVTPRRARFERSRRAPSRST